MRCRSLIAQMGAASLPPTRDLSGTDPLIATSLIEAAPDDIDWDWGRKVILPMRALGDPDGSRVKAWRKLTHEQTLPPVLTWNNTALSASFILDGHDRLVAALAEGYSPVMIELRECDPDGRGALSKEMQRLEKAVSERPKAYREHDAYAQAAVRAAAIDGERTRTTAWVSSCKVE